MQHGSREQTGGNTGVLIKTVISALHVPSCKENDFIRIAFI
jgi:hypothetical protein